MNDFLSSGRGRRLVLWSGSYIVVATLLHFYAGAPARALFFAGVLTLVAAFLIPVRGGR